MGLQGPAPGEAARYGRGAALSPSTTDLLTAGQGWLLLVGRPVGAPGAHGRGGLRELPRDVHQAASRLTRIPDSACLPPSDSGPFRTIPYQAPKKKLKFYGNRSIVPLSSDS